MKCMGAVDPVAYLACELICQATSGSNGPQVTSLPGREKFCAHAFAYIEEIDAGPIVLFERWWGWSLSQICCLRYDFWRVELPPSGKTDRRTTN